MTFKANSKSQILSIAKREISRALRSPGYYILLSFIVFIQGYEFCLLFISDGALAIRALMRESAFLMLFGAPIITAGSIASERSNNELKWFLSQPVSETTIIAGKFLGGFILLLPLALSAFIPAVTAIYYGNLPVAPIITAISGLLLVALACGSAGLFASSFAKKSSTAAALALGLLFVLIFTGSIGSKMVINSALNEPSSLSTINSMAASAASAGAFNPFSLADYMFRGVLDSRPIIFFLSSTLLFIALSVISLKSERWQFPDKEGPIGSKLYSRQTLVAARMGFYFGVSVIIFAAIHFINISFHVHKDLSGYLTLSTNSTKLINNLPEHLVIYRVKKENNFIKTRLDDLVDEIVRTGNGKVTKDRWNEKLHFSTLRPLGLLGRPDNGVVLRLGQRVLAIGEEELYVISRKAELSLFRGIKSLIPGNGEFHIYFSKGHNEIATSKAQKLINTFGMECSELIISSKNSIKPELTAKATMPTNQIATCLVIAGPQIPFSEKDLQKIKTYLDEGGKLLLSIDYNFPKAYKPLLNLLPVKSSGNVIRDKHHSFAGGGETSLIVIPKPDNPIAKSTGPIQLVFPEATDITLTPDREDGLHSYLLETSSLALFQYSKKDNTSNFGPQNIDKAKGRKTIAVTIMGAQLKRPYLACVLGTSQWLSNSVLSTYEGQGIFLKSIIEWLFHKTGSNTIEQEPIEPKLVLSKKDSKRLIYVVAAFPAFAILFCGFVAYVRYRKRLKMRT